MSHSLSNLLLLYAQQFEDQHAPQNMTIALREAARELDRLYAGGCARDQSTTQYCAEAARLAVENEQNRIDLEEYRRDVERLTAALERDAVYFDSLNKPAYALIARAALHPANKEEVNS
jgi:hypothetical protein